MKAASSPKKAPGALDKSHGTWDALGELNRGLGAGLYDVRL